jgi:hypothetical protein
MAVNDRRRNEPIRNRVHWFALAASLLLACSDSAGPTSPLPFQLSFTAPTSPTYSGPRIVGTATAIIVTARVGTPTPCTDLTATVNQRAATIDITMTATQENVICEQSLGVIDYTLVVTPIAPGTYHVTVHQVGAVVGANTTFTQDVTVPG